MSSTTYWYLLGPQGVTTAAFPRLVSVWNKGNVSWDDVLGAVSIRKTVLPGMAIPMLKIRRPNGRLIFNMEITIRK